MKSFVEVKAVSFSGFVWSGIGSLCAVVDNQCHLSLQTKIAGGTVLHTHLLCLCPMASLATELTTDHWSWHTAQIGSLILGFLVFRGLRGMFFV